MSVFDDIYKSNTWGFGSGHGSLPSVTKGYRALLETFIRENNVRSVVDYGSGDWQFSKLVEWGDIEYTGVDVVPSLTAENTTKYGNQKRTFLTISPGSNDIPDADLLICKDVLQHIPNQAVQEFVANVLPKFKYALITNCILSPEPVNSDIGAGGFRGLDIRKAPFCVDAKVVYSFSGPKVFSWRQRRFFPAWKKLVILVG